MTRQASRIISALLFGCGLGWPVVARADVGLMPALDAGLALVHLPSDAGARFRIGLGVDLLATSGLVLACRAETTHTIDSTVAIQGGWLGRGIMEGIGWPLGFLAGPSLTMTHEGDLLAGARVELRLGLWFGRAVIAVDASVKHTFSDRAPSLSAIETGIALRFAPWPAFVL